MHSTAVSKTILLQGGHGIQECLSTWTRVNSYISSSPGRAPTIHTLCLKQCCQKHPKPNTIINAWKWTYRAHGNAWQKRCQTTEVRSASENYLINKEAAQDATISVAQQNTEGCVVENASEPFELDVHTTYGNIKTLKNNINKKTQADSC